MLYHIKLHAFQLKTFNYILFEHVMGLILLMNIFGTMNVNIYTMLSMPLIL